MSPEVREVLRKVRDEILTPETWGQGLPGVHAGDDCLHTAIGKTVLSGNYSAYAFECYRALGFERVTDVWTWNDDPSRTFEDVRALLDKALAEPVKGAAA